MARMSTAQNIAFNTANSSVSFDASDVGVFIASVGIALILTWCAWVAVSSYRCLRKPGTTAADAAGKVVRAVFVMTIVIAVMAL